MPYYILKFATKIIFSKKYIFFKLERKKCAKIKCSHVGDIICGIFKLFNKHLN